MSGTDAINWDPHLKVRKYHPDQVTAMTAHLGYEPTGEDLVRLETQGLFAPDEVLEVPGNLLVTTGLNRIGGLIIGTGAINPFSNSFGYVGVGDSTTPAVVGDTALNAATNKYYRPLDASNPTQSNGVITANCTFGSAEANYAWQEWIWGVSNASSPAAGSAQPAGVALNHKVQSLGTKVSGSIWTHQATVTLS